MTTVAREQARPISRVPFLVAGVAVFAFLDMELLTRHLLELYAYPLGFAQLVVRPVLVLAALLCLIMLYIEGATPRSEIVDSRRRSAFLATAFCILAFVLAFLVVITFPPEMRTEQWDNGPGSSGSATYPILDSWPKIIAFVPWVVAAIGTIVLPIMAMIAPPYIMRFGWQGIGWRFLKTLWRHRQAYGWRTLLLLPIALIAWPAREFWMAGMWQSDGVVSAKDMSEIGEVLRWNEWIGADLVALSAGIAAALFGLLLWWIGKSVGKALDTGEQSKTTIDVQIGD